MDNEAPIFRAILTPHRSLGRSGHVWLVGSVGFASLIVCIVFIASGAWPVAPFMGLDVLLIWLALRVNTRDARAFDEVCLSPHDLRLTKVEPGGQTSEHHFNPRWVKLVQEAHEEFGVLRLSLIERGRSVDFGSFLPPCEKASFHAAFARALGEAKRGILPA